MAVKKTKRQYLDDYSRALRDIELAGIAIDILEKVRGSQSIVRMLKNKSISRLKRLDAAAAKLGAPYGGIKP